MKRNVYQYLLEWKDRKNRKPLIVRGARQTGKTYIVEKFAETEFDSFLTVDFEFDIQIKSIFQHRDPIKIINELSLYFDKEITAGTTLLFLDEIQACPEVIVSLRYFYEKMPEMHVIAAGSLLDFTLRDFRYSMPVGRVEFLYMNPMSFEEFVHAVSPKLLNYLRSWSFEDEISNALHAKLTDLLRTFFFTGGMPEVVASYVSNQNFLDVQRSQNSILTAMQNDFNKYGSRNQQEILQKVMHHVPRNIGRKVKYVNIDNSLRSSVLKEAFNLLEMSNVIHRIRKSSGNGVPLDAESSDVNYKSIFLDVGLVNRICGLKLTHPEELTTVYEGGLAEQFIGQELINRGYEFEKNHLYYWSREAKNSNAEIDYLISRKNHVIPVEVKAGHTGGLKSLHLFLYEKSLRKGLRFNMDKPSIGDFESHVYLKNKTVNLNYSLISLPLYLAGQVDRIMDEATNFFPMR